MTPPATQQSSKRSSEPDASAANAIGATVPGGSAMKRTPSVSDLPGKFDARSASTGPAILSGPTEFDPLRTIQWDDYFWNYVDTYFQPLNKDDVLNFRRLPPSTLHAGDEALDAPIEEIKNNSKNNTNNSSSPKPNAATAGLPLSQRLVAALLDDGTTPPPSPIENRTQGISAAAAGAVASGTAKERARQQEALETRVAHELVQLGLISDNHDQLTSATRAQQGRLRELKASNAARHRALARAAIQAELRTQAAKREERRHQDKIQIAYLNRMLSRLKKNKKSRAKLQKLLSRNFGHYDEKRDSADKATPQNNRAKKKRKEPPTSHSHTAKKHAPAKKLGAAAAAAASSKTPDNL